MPYVCVVSLTILNLGKPGPDKMSENTIPLPRNVKKFQISSTNQIYFPFSGFHFNSSLFMLSFYLKNKKNKKTTTTTITTTTKAFFFSTLIIPKRTNSDTSPKGIHSNANKRKIITCMQNQSISNGHKTNIKKNLIQNKGGSRHKN